MEFSKDRAQARVILIRLRKEVFDEWQRRLKYKEPTDGSDEGFRLLTNAIGRI